MTKVSVVFFACGVVSSLIVGRLADVMKRSTLVCLCMLIGSTGILGVVVL